MRILHGYFLIMLVNGGKSLIVFLIDFMCKNSGQLRSCFELFKLLLKHLSFQFVNEVFLLNFLILDFLFNELSNVLAYNSVLLHGLKMFIFLIVKWNESFIFLHCLMMKDMLKSSSEHFFLQGHFHQNTTCFQVFDFLLIVSK